MAKIYQNILELIGKTPLVRLNRYGEKEQLEANILAKLEYFNPNGSVKDRIAYNIIRAKEESGELKPGGTIIEGTSGNTGIGLAAIGAALGYKVKIAPPDKMLRPLANKLQEKNAPITYKTINTNHSFVGQRMKLTRIVGEWIESVIEG